MDVNKFVSSSSPVAESPSGSYLSDRVEKPRPTSYSDQLSLSGVVESRNGARKLVRSVTMQKFNISKLCGDGVTVKAIRDLLKNDDSFLDNLYMYKSYELSHNKALELINNKNGTLSSNHGNYASSKAFQDHLVPSTRTCSQAHLNVDTSKLKVMNNPASLPGEPEGNPLLAASTATLPAQTNILDNTSPIALSEIFSDKWFNASWPISILPELKIKSLPQGKQKVLWHYCKSPNPQNCVHHNTINCQFSIERCVNNSSTLLEVIWDYEGFKATPKNSSLHILLIQKIKDWYQQHYEHVAFVTCAKEYDQVKEFLKAGVKALPAEEGKNAADKNLSDDVKDLARIHGSLDLVVITRDGGFLKIAKKVKETYNGKVIWITSEETVKIISQWLSTVNFDKKVTWSKLKRLFYTCDELWILFQKQGGLPIRRVDKDLLFQTHGEEIKFINAM